MVAVLFVCLGNICRSPAAEGVCKHLAEKEYDLHDLEVASCGLGDWHAGSLPDSRMREASKSRGIILTSRAQAFEEIFFEQFDYILAADHAVLKELHSFAHKAEHKKKIQLMTAYSKSYAQKEIPDPFYGNRSAFDLALDMIEDACEGFLTHLKRQGK